MNLIRRMALCAFVAFISAASSTAFAAKIAKSAQDAKAVWQEAVAADEQKDYARAFRLY